MYLNKRVLGIIPARGGSKGLPRKNIMETHGKPLISWTIKQAIKSRYIDRVVVSTDDKEIAEISRCEGADIPYIRPSILATDTAKTTDVVMHLINRLKEVGEIYDVIVLLEPTSPLRKENDIDLAIEALGKNGEFDGAITLGNYKTHPRLAKSVKQRRVIECSTNDNQKRRQDMEQLYFPFGVAYVATTAAFERELTFYTAKLSYHIIEDWQCYEIDDYWDWVCVKAIMQEVKEFS